MDFDKTSSSGYYSRSSDILNKTSGQWAHLLTTIGGLHPDQLSGNHQPCPACGGTDRFRWISDKGPGGWYCSYCGGKGQQGGGGSGLDLLMRVRGWSFREAINQLDRYYGGLPFEPAPKRPAPMPQPETSSSRHSELECFRLLELAGQLTQTEGYSPLKAKTRVYSARWQAFASSYYAFARSVVLQYEVERGITEIPADMGVYGL